MYWILALVWSIAGTALFWKHLSKRWQKRDLFEKMSISTLGILHPIPADSEMGYLRLQFSILRHAIVFLIFAIIIYFVKSQTVLHLLLLINLLYCWSPLSRYLYRKKDLDETAANPDSKSVADLISGFIKDSFCTVVHAVICAVLLYVLFAIRPY